MNSGLWRRLGYPRRLDDGSFAVQLGFDRYRLEADEFARYVEGYAISRWLSILGDGGWAIFTFCLFFASGIGLPAVILIVGFPAVVEAVEFRSRVKRFKAEFPRVRPIRVLPGRWPGYGVLARMACSGRLFVWMLAVMVVGWGTGGVFQHAYLRTEIYFGWPMDTLLYGAAMAVSGIFYLTILVYYRATRGCRLSLQNLERTESGASFVDAI